MPRKFFLRAVAPYVSLQNFDNILIKHMRKAGIPLDSIKHHGLHSLRHSLATHMLDEGIPITSIQGVLGHINADSTQKIYWCKCTSASQLRIGGD